MYDVYFIKILFYLAVQLYSEVKIAFLYCFYLNHVNILIGFGDRLLGELKRIAPKEVKIKISAPRERLYSTWIG